MTKGDVWGVAIFSFAAGFGGALAHSRWYSGPRPWLPPQQDPALTFVFCVFSFVIVGGLALLAALVATNAAIEWAVARRRLRHDTGDWLGFLIVGAMSGYFGGLAVARTLGWH